MRLTSRPSADLVTSFHTIEHVSDPLRELRLLRGLMRPGATLLLLTPNVRSLNARIFPRTWEWTSPPVHVHLFSPASLSRVLGDAGFRIRRCTTARGNGKGFLFELLRSGVHQLTGRAGARDEDGSPPPLRGTRRWYTVAEALVQVASLPFWMLLPLYRGLRLAPEIGVVAQAD